MIRLGDPLGSVENADVTANKFYSHREKRAAEFQEAAYKSAKETEAAYRRSSASESPETSRGFKEITNCGERIGATWN
jgi:hypothetical protein